MRLFIRPLQGRPLLYNVKEDELVWKVLALVPPGGLPSDYAVTWNGELLDLNRTLSSYGIREDHMLHAVGAPKVRGAQQRHRRWRQMATQVTVFQEREEREALQDDDETEPATLAEPTTFSEPHSHSSFLLACQAAITAAELSGTASAGGSRKKRKVRP